MSIVKNIISIKRIIMPLKQIPARRKETAIVFCLILPCSPGGHHCLTIPPQMNFFLHPFIYISKEWPWEDTQSTGWVCMIHFGYLPPTIKMSRCKTNFLKELTGWHEDKPSTLEVGVVLHTSRWYEAVLHLTEGHIFIYTWKEPIKLMSWKQPHVIAHCKSLCTIECILKTSTFFFPNVTTTIYTFPLTVQILAAASGQTKVRCWIVKLLLWNYPNCPCPYEHFL